MSVYIGIGMILSGFYHLIVATGLGLIIFTILKQTDNKDIYINYLFVGIIGSTIVFDIYLFVLYLVNAIKSDMISVGIIVLLVLSIVTDLYLMILFIRYVLDKITCVLPMLMSIVTIVLRGCAYNVVDTFLGNSKIKAINGPIFSVWSFMFLFFFLALIVCTIIYLDYGFLSEILENPDKLFSKNTLYGTYTNLYLNNEKRTEEDQIQHEQLISNNKTMQQSSAIPQEKLTQQLQAMQSDQSMNQMESMKQLQAQSLSVTQNQVEMVNRNDTNVKRIKIFVLVGSLAIVALLCILGVGVFALNRLSVDHDTKEVISGIDSIGTIEASDKELIDGLLDKYSKLSDKQKKKVKNYNKLLEAEKEANELYKDDAKTVAKEIYDELNDVYATSDIIMGTVSSAWHYGIFGEDDSYDVWGGFASETGMDKEKLKSAYKSLYASSDNEIYNEVLMFGPTDFQSCVNTVIQVYRDEGILDTCDTELTDAETKLKEIYNANPDEQYISDLRDYYSKVKGYYDFATSPSGSYDELSATVEGHRKDIDDLKNSLSFDLEP